MQRVFPRFFGFSVFVRPSLLVEGYLLLAASFREKNRGIGRSIIPGSREEAFDQPPKPSTGASTTVGTGTEMVADLSRPSTDSIRYLREGSDRLGRNLDQIGGGNLLRRGQPERESYDSPRLLPAKRNLDQIGGGNLLRGVDDRFDRNLDQIGGGNLVRGLDDVADAADNFRRNLDQIGGGNLVRGLAEAMVREMARERAAESRSHPRSRFAGQ